jgi:hypothetical protein
MGDLFAVLRGGIFGLLAEKSLEWWNGAFGGILTIWGGVFVVKLW